MNGEYSTTMNGEYKQTCLVCGGPCGSYSGCIDLLAILRHQNSQYEVIFPVASKLVELINDIYLTSDTDILKHLSNFPSQSLCAQCFYYLTDFMTAEQLVADAKTLLKDRINETIDLITSSLPNLDPHPSSSEPSPAIKRTLPLPGCQACPKKNLKMSPPKLSTLKPLRKPPKTLSIVHHGPNEAENRLNPLASSSCSEASPSRAGTPGLEQNGTSDNTGNQLMSNLSPSLFCAENMGDESCEAELEQSDDPEDQTSRSATPLSTKQRRKPVLIKLACPARDCKKIFKSIVHLYTHVAKYHRKEISHICPFCAQQASSKDKLMLHLYNEHKHSRNLSWYFCRDCPSMFAQIAQWRRHENLFKHKAWSKTYSPASLHRAEDGQSKYPPQRAERSTSRTEPQENQTAIQAATSSAALDSTNEKESLDECSGKSSSLSNHVTQLACLQPIVKVKKLSLGKFVPTSEGRYVFPQAPPLPETHCVQPPTPKPSFVTLPPASLFKTPAPLVAELQDEDFIDEESVESETDMENHGPNLASTSPCQLVCPGVAYGHIYANINVSNQHIIKQHDKDILSTCPYCAQAFLTVTEMDQHVSNKHTADNPYHYKCPECAAMFAQHDKLEEHMKWWNHTENQAGTSVHTKVPIGHPIPTADVERDLEHANIQGQPQREGIIPSYLLVLSDHLTAAPSTGHNVNNIPLTPSFGGGQNQLPGEIEPLNLSASSTCGSETQDPTTSSISEGEKAKELDFQCPICKQTRSFFNVLNTHILDRHSEIVHMCRLCRSIFSSRIELDEHMLQLHPASFTTGFRCPTCPGHYTGRVGLLKHLARYRHGTPPVRCTTPSATLKN